MPPAPTTASRRYGFDWRDRLTTTTTSDGTTTYIDLNIYDNQDDVIETGRLSRQHRRRNRISDTLTSLRQPGPRLPDDRRSASTRRPAMRTAARWSPTRSSTRTDNVIETQAGGTQELTKTAYNGLGERHGRRTSVIDPSGDASTFASAGSVAGDIILEETNTQFDAAGDATFVTTYERYDDAPTSDTGHSMSCSTARFAGFLRGLLVRRHRPGDRRAEFWGDGQPSHARAGQRPARNRHQRRRRRSA